MTDKQPEALVWAGQLELLLPFMSPATFIAANKAIAELRRLHEENEALRARLAQPEPEPVAWISAEETWLVPKLVISDTPKDGYKPVYTAPPQREWKGLTDEEIDELAEANLDFNWKDGVEDFARAIEAKLKAKNG